MGSTYTFKYINTMWDEARKHKGQDEMDPLIRVLQVACMRESHGAARRSHTKHRWLQMDIDVYNNVMLPINLPQHWLLAWIDVRSRKMHLLDCSKEYGASCRGTMHGLLWVWLLASVRRRNAATGDAHAEPVWAIDLRTVEVDDLSLLPGFHEGCP